MADEFFTRTHAPVAMPSRRGGGRFVVAGVLLAFLLGAGATSYLAWSGMLPIERLAKPASSTSAASGGKVPLTAPTGTAVADPMLQSATTRQGALETRIVALEQRLAQIDLRTEAAQGNAARSEALLVAFAARRALDRGAPLGYLENQLQLRFGEAQPRAVATVIEAASKPVTLHQLTAGLDALAPRLSATPAEELGTWQTIKRELSGLFVIRRDSTPSTAPAQRIDRARVSIEAGRIDDAIGEIQNLPGAGDAAGWIADARRYEAARAALDLIETSALLEPRALHDRAGHQIEQVSPASPPAIGAAEQAAN